MNGFQFARRTCVAGIVGAGLAAADPPRSPPTNPQAPACRPHQGRGTIIVAPGFGFGGGFGFPGYYGASFGGAYYGSGLSLGVPAYGYGFDAYAWEQQRQELLLQRQRQQQEAETAALAERQEQREAAAKLAGERRAGARKDRARLAEKTGRTLFAAGQFRRAGERFKEALDGDPEAHRHFLLAQAKFAQKRFAEAAQEVRNGLRAHPDWPAKPFDVRTLYGAEADFLGQLAVLAGEVKANPADADALFLFGYELFVSARRPQAKAVLEAAAKADAAADGVAALLAEAK